MKNSDGNVFNVFEHRRLVKYSFLLAIVWRIVINPRRTCAARVTVVGLSVCLSTLILHYRLRGGLLAIPAPSELREP